MQFGSHWGAVWEDLGGFHEGAAPRLAARECCGQLGGTKQEGDTTGEEKDEEEEEEEEGEEDKTVFWAFSGFLMGVLWSSLGASWGPFGRS